MTTRSESASASAIGARRCRSDAGRGSYAVLVTAAAMRPAFDVHNRPAGRATGSSQTSARTRHGTRSPTRCGRPLSAVQFYDWMYRHASAASTDDFVDALGRDAVPATCAGWWTAIAQPVDSPRLRRGLRAGGTMRSHPEVLHHRGRTAVDARRLPLDHGHPPDSLVAAHRPDPRGVSRRLRRPSPRPVRRPQGRGDGAGDGGLLVEAFVAVSRRARSHGGDLMLHQLNDFLRRTSAPTGRDLHRGVAAARRLRGPCRLVGLPAPRRRSTVILALPTCRETAAREVIESATGARTASGGSTYFREPAFWRPVTSHSRCQRSCPSPSSSFVGVPTATCFPDAALTRPSARGENATAHGRPSEPARSGHPQHGAHSFGRVVTTRRACARQQPARGRNHVRQAVDVGRRSRVARARPSARAAPAAGPELPPDATVTRPTWSRSRVGAWAVMLPSSVRRGDPAARCPRRR